MTTHPTLTVRRLLVDLTTPFARRWNGGDAFRSAFFNALSMSFPAGEQLFIDAVREGAKGLAPETPERAALERALQGFIGQEATHRRVHALFNTELARQGHVNTWERRIVRRMEKLRNADARHALAITAATEHLTAILAEHLLAHAKAVLAGAEPRLATMWLWHASEEMEHRSVAFDLYRALGGDERWRRRWFRVISTYFASDVLRQTVRNLAHDGALLAPSTWLGAARFLFGREHGLVRHVFRPWCAYFAARFHPLQHGGERGAEWLRDNTEHFAAVR